MEESKKGKGKSKKGKREIYVLPENSEGTQGIFMI